MRKKIIAGLLSSYVLCAHAGTHHHIAINSQATEVDVSFRASSPRLGSAIAMIYDEQEQRPLYAKNIDNVVPIASITKLMTAMVILDAKLPLDEPITITAQDRDHFKGTRSRMRNGMTLTRGDMLQLALMASENTAAASLARTFPGGTQVMLAMMNAKAHELGMDSTRFDDPTGLHSTNVSTAQDLVKMVMAARRYEDIQRYTTSHSHIVKVIVPQHAALSQHQSPGQKRFLGYRSEQDRIHQRGRTLPGDAGEDIQSSGGHRAAGFMGQTHPSGRCQPHQTLDGRCG